MPGIFRVGKTPIHEPLINDEPPAAVTIGEFSEEKFMRRIMSSPTQVSVAYDDSGLLSLEAGGCPPESVLTYRWILLDGCHSDKKMLQALEPLFHGHRLLIKGSVCLWKIIKLGSSFQKKCLISECGDPKTGVGNGMGDGHSSNGTGGGGVGGRCRYDHSSHFGCGGGHSDHLGSGGDGHSIHSDHPGSGGCSGSGGHRSIAIGVPACKSKYRLADVPSECIRFLLMSAAVYFATLGFSNTIIARELRGDNNGTHSIITDLAKANHTFFQVFILANIFGFATSSGALVIRDRGTLKSEVMFQTCSIIAFLCLAVSFSVLVIVCAFLSLAFTGSNG